VNQTPCNQSPNQPSQNHHKLSSRPQPFQNTNSAINSAINPQLASPYLNTHLPCHSIQSISVSFLTHHGTTHYHQHRTKSTVPLTTITITIPPLPNQTIQIRYITT
jgi:hypothetical protein